MTEHPRLCKTIEYLVTKYGPIQGYFRLQRLVYVAEHEWAKTHDGKPYTEAVYHRWNHGPFSREMLRALEWMNGIEVVGTEANDESQEIYKAGVSNRLGIVQLDEEFRTLLDVVGKQWAFASLLELTTHIYEDAEFKKKKFGDMLLG